MLVDTLSAVVALVVVASASVATVVAGVEVASASATMLVLIAATNMVTRCRAAKCFQSCLDSWQGQFFNPLLCRGYPAPREFDHIMIAALSL